MRKSDAGRSLKRAENNRETPPDGAKKGLTERK